MPTCLGESLPRPLGLVRGLIKFSSFTALRHVHAGLHAPTSVMDPAGHFDNPDPFAADAAEHQDEAARSGSTSSEHSRQGLEQATQRPVRFLSPTDTQATATTSHNDKSLHKEDTADDRSNSHQEGVIEKIKTAAEDAAPHLAERVKSAKHRLHLDHVKAHRPIKYLNPTNIRMNVRFSGGSDDSADIQRAKELALMWRSRDNRKGRNSIAVPLPPEAQDGPTFLPSWYTPKIKTNLKDIGNTFYRMATTFPYWDMAFWSGWSYTFGSVLFVADGVLAWGPVAKGDSFESTTAQTYAGPLCFFFGALLYQVGAVAAYLEAVNDGSFHGAAMRRLLEGHEDDQKKLLDDKIHDFFSHLKPIHRHKDDSDAEKLADQVDPEAGWRTKEARHLRPGSIYPQGKTPAPRRPAVDLGGEEGQTVVYSEWRWWPTWHALRTHHVYEIGYIACTIQLFGVTLYGITAIVVLPGILDSLAPWQELGAYWVPQVVAAACFLIASLLFMFETQEKWWKPEVTVLGWWVGFLASIGSIGFELIAIFGILAQTRGHWAEYQSDLSTIWGSAAYFSCSFLQWYEALAKNPIEELMNEPGEMKSWQVHPL